MMLRSGRISGYNSGNTLTDKQSQNDALDDMAQMFG